MKRNNVRLFFVLVLSIALMTLLLTGAAQSPEESWAQKLEKREGAIEAKRVSKPDEASRVFEIDKGAQDGLVEGDIVCGSHSLIGRLYQVNENTAMVEIIGPGELVNHLLAAKQRPETLDEVYGNIGQYMSAMFIFPKTKLDQGSIGDAVYTLGSEGGFPEGLLVGFVADHKLAEVPEGVWTVRLPLDLRYLETVYIFHVN